MRFWNKLHQVLSVYMYYGSMVVSLSWTALFNRVSGTFKDFVKDFREYRKPKQFICAFDRTISLAIH
jgi:hypothetical protein